MPPSSSAPTVLIVDDNHGDFVLLSEAWKDLKLAGGLEHAPTAKICLGRLETPPTPRLIVVDINLPIMDGRELIAAVRRKPQFSDVPIVIYSSSHDRRYAETARSCGAQGYFQKPLVFEDYFPFLQALRDLIECVAPENGDPADPRRA